MTTIADCIIGETIEIPHGWFIVEDVEDVTGMFDRAEKLVTLRRLDAEGYAINGEAGVLRFQGEPEMILR